MKHTQTWTDVYGSACASFEGRAGGHRWLVAAPPELAANVPAALEAVDGKGSVQLLVHEGLTPLLSAVRSNDPRGVLVVAAQALASGPAVRLEAQTVEATGDGTDYHEGGEFPAWQGAVPWNGPSGENAAASAVAQAGFPVVVTDAANVQAALEGWMSVTPHGR
ncbi:hypothetical protein [Deinococcus sp.]|uniref:hypothetical protein n=1 Tax=Deinococcus sp. TaxID=47478 RepID=UPI0025BCDBB3|nr:hypothetical protein [Deinococcus sp.]